MNKKFLKIISKRLILRRSKLIFKLILIFLASFLILTNIWWFIDCKICLGGICEFSVCKNHKHQKPCVNGCYKGNQINDKNIGFKILNKTSNTLQRIYSDLFWQKIPGFGIRVYSAFYTQNFVLIIAQVNKEKDYEKQFECVFSDKNKTNILFKSELKIEEYEESYSSYVSARIRCRLSHSKEILNNYKYVKLVNKKDTNIETKYIFINKNLNKESAIDEIVVCVRPLFGRYSSLRSLLEFFAYYRINGINRFVIYKESVSEEVSQLLDSMTEFVEIIPWITSDGLINEIEDQLTSVDDCLHRFEGKIILFTDIDEFLIPFGFKRLKEFLMYEKRVSLKTAALSLQNVFFCCEFNSDNYKSFPRILSQFNRQMNVWPKGLRSKVIVLRTEMIDWIGIHSVSSLSSNYSSIVKHLDKNIALMFHYRSCCGVRRIPVLGGIFSFRTVNDFSITDERMNKFNSEILEFIKQYIYL